MARIQKSQPAYHQSYEIIRDMIIRGVIPAGTKVVEEKLAAELGVSRTPIRESIRRLEQDGLIQDKWVVEPSAQDLRDMYQVRMLLEGYAAGAAVDKISEVELNLLWECVQIGRTGTKDEVIKANTLFHETIIQAGGNQVIIDIIERMRSLIMIFRRRSVYDDRPHLIDEHEQIYEAIRDKDGRTAEQLMQQHLAHDRDFLLAVFT